MNKNKFICDRFRTGYLDESGNNGGKGSEYLILTYVCVRENKKIAKILKKAKEQLKRTKKGSKWLEKNGGEIKFYGFPEDHVLRKVLEELSKLDIIIRYIAIKKNGKNFNPSEKADVLTELISSHLASDECIPSKIVADRDYFDDKKIAYFLLRNYEEKVHNGENGQEKEVRCELFLIERYDLEKFKDNELVVSIRHENSRGNLNLQATDLISGAIFQEFEKGNKTYAEILRKNIKMKGIVREIK